MKKRTLITGILLAMLLLVSACGRAATDETESKATEGENATETEATKASSEEIVNTGDFTIETADGVFAQNGSVYTITSAGTYTLSGTLSEGQIVISAGDEDEVTLYLNGVSVASDTNAPIWAKTADKVKICAVEGTANSVSDVRALKTADSDTMGAAAIYAETDLTVEGTGSLTVTASYNNGIQTKDDLKIKDVTLTVTAPNNALKGNDSITVESGNVTAEATAGDAMKSDNSDISSKGNQRGIITVSGGTLDLSAEDDGIDAAYNVEISGGTVTVKANGKGIVADNEVVISGGTVTVSSTDDAIHANQDNALESGATPNGNITVSGGTVTVSTGDDGLHADGTLLITNGTVTVEKSREGLEGHYVTVEGGQIYIYATDDGVNASGSSSKTADGVIKVTGGELYVEVAGMDTDGIDANGSYYQTGGFVMVSNPNADSSGNMAAVDADQTVSVTGGVIVALGTVPGQSNMGGGNMGGKNMGGRFGMGGMNSGSSLPSGYVTYSGTLAAGTHTFTYNGSSYTFTLQQSVRNGWIWANGISSGNYTLK